MKATHATDVTAQKWDAVWRTLTETGEISEGDLTHLGDGKRQSVICALDELSELGFVESTESRWVRAF